MGNFTDPELLAWMKQESKKKTGESKKSLQKRYYDTVYQDKINQAVQQAMEANPSLSFDGKQLVNQETGQTYKIDNPNKVKPGKSREDQFSAIRNLKNITNAAKGVDWERRPKEIKATAKHGKGGGVFGKIGEGVSGYVKSAGNVLKSAGEIAGSSLKATGKLATGDFKGAGKAGMQGFSSASDIAGEVGGQTGSIFGNKKLGNMAGRIAGEIGANVATGGGYGLAKSATQSLSGDGLKGLLKGEALTDAVVSSAGSQFGVDPSILKAGLAATKGDIKGAALQSLGSLGGLDPKQMKYASTGLSALTGDKKGTASGLASSFGASDNIANMLGSAAVKDKRGLASSLASNFGASENVANMLGSAAVKDKRGLASNLASNFGAGEKASDIVGQLAGGRGVREVTSDQVGAYAKDEANSMLDARLPPELQKIKEKGIDFEKINKEARASQLAKAGKNVTDKYLKDAQGKTIYGKNNAPILNPNFKPEEYDKLQARKAEESRGFLDKAGDFLGTAKDKVTGALGTARDFAAENKTALGLGADVAAAYGGYKAGQAGREEAIDLQEQQMADLARAGKQFEGMNYDPQRYAQEQEFLKQRIAGGGVTDVERQMQQQGDIRAARAAAAQRMSGIETQARLGGAGLGTAALAGALAGGQSEQNIQSEANLAREASASERLQRDIERTGALSTRQTQEEADLAQAQGQFGLSRAAQTGISRANLSELEMAKAGALQNLYGKGAEFAKTGLSLMKTPEELKREADQRAYDAQMKNLDLQEKQAKIQQMTGGASNVVQNKGSVPPAGTKTPQVKQPPQPQAQKPAATAPIGKFNQTNQNYTGPMARPVNTAVNTAQKAKEEADKFKKDPWGTVSSWGKK